MRQIQNGITENQNELMVYRKAPKFVPAGQSTQMIIGMLPRRTTIRLCVCPRHSMRSFI